MKSYLIRYPITNPKNDYQSIIRCIQENYELNIQIGEGTWIIKTTQSAEHILNLLLCYCDRKEQLIVIEIYKDWLCHNLPETTTKWLKRYL